MANMNLGPNGLKDENGTIVAEPHPSSGAGRVLQLGPDYKLGVDLFGNETWRNRSFSGLNTGVYSGGTSSVSDAYYAIMTPHWDGDSSTGSFEFPYTYVVTGPTYESNSANTYYPLSLAPGGFRTAHSGANIVIQRSYGHPGPAQNGGASIGWTGSTTHQGGLYLSFRVGDSAWSDMFESQLVRYRLTYHEVVSDYGMLLGNTTGSGPFWIRLRGGFVYYIHSKHPAWPAWVQPNGPALTHAGNPNYQTWPGTTTTVNNSVFNGNYTSDYV
jgi:hypothetical protein